MGPEDIALKMLVAAGFAVALACPALAQTPGQAPEPKEEAESSAPPMKDRFFFGGGVGAAFGTVDYFEIAPLIGMRVAPRVDLGLQPFYRWTNDGRYSPSVESTDYGARLFTRVRIVSSFFAEADYQYTNYEYVNSFGGTTRTANNAFLAGVGYTVPVGGSAGLFFSALYDFTYDSNDPYAPYDSPVQFQIGVSVGF